MEAKVAEEAEADRLRRIAYWKQYREINDLDWRLYTDFLDADSEDEEASDSDADEEARAKKMESGLAENPKNAEKQEVKVEDNNQVEKASHVKEAFHVEKASHTEKAAHVADDMHAEAQVKKTSTVEEAAAALAKLASTDTEDT